MDDDLLSEGWSPQDIERKNRLYAACKAGDAAVVPQLLTQLSSSVGSSTSRARTLKSLTLGVLDRAAENGHIGASRAILDHAVAADFDGDALHKSLLRAVNATKGQGHADVVRFLLDRGASIEFFPSSIQAQLPSYFPRQSALYTAVRDRRADHFFNVDIIDLLIQRGADVNWEDGGWSLLYHACRGTAQDERVVAPVAVARLLIEGGAVVDTATSLGHTLKL